MRAVHRPGFLLFLDCETSGLDPKQHEITQVAAVVVDRTLTEFGKLDYKLHFDEGAADPKSLEMNHYDRELWQKEAVEPQVFMGHLEGLCREYASVEMFSNRTGKPFYIAQMAGHNAERFDFEFLRALYKSRDRFLPIAFRVLDTAQMALLYMHENPGAIRDTKLQTLAEHFGVKVEGEAHAALPDVRTNIQVYRCLRKALLDPAAGGASPAPPPPQPPVEDLF
jgi:DNA polymerase-3 subunit epsilon